jgi:polygalacturonase
MRRVSRRRFVRDGAAGFAAAYLAGRAAPAWGLVQEPAGWDQADAILRRIAVPVFPDRAFPITNYGAVADGATPCTAAIARAITACAAAGGGRVTVPAGTFLTGAVHLRSGINLEVAAGATLKFIQDPQAYLPAVFTRFEGVELMNYSPFVYAFEQQNIAITGRGTLDGQADADHWWPWAGGGRARGLPTQAADRPRLVDLAARGVPVIERMFGGGPYMRPNFIQPYQCRNVLVEGITIVNSPMWEIHPVLCRNVTVRDVSISSHRPNNDGCNPESSRDVLIERCTFDTGDDCIAIKSGRNEDGRRVNVPSENIVVRDCTMKDGHGGVVIGSEVSGGVRNVFAERCRMDSPRLDRVLRFKTNSVRGGTIEHVYMRDITVGEVAEAVVTADFFYEEGDAGAFPPVLRDVEVRRVTSRKSRYALRLRGYAHDPITNVRVTDCTFDGVAEPDVLEGVKDLTLTNVRINGQVRTQHIDR